MLHFGHWTLDFGLTLMSSPTFYIPPKQIVDDTATLTGDELRHARLTLRLGTGDAVRIVNGEGTSWNAIIESIGKAKGSLTLSDKRVEPNPSFTLTIAMGIVPGDRYDWAIQKSTELGANGFIPLVTERTEFKSKGNWKRVDRLKRVVI
jgi:16S rRNA (uracil1498-N3)-methyltransferase